MNNNDCIALLLLVTVLLCCHVLSELAYTCMYEVYLHKDTLQHYGCYSHTGVIEPVGGVKIEKRDDSCNITLSWEAPFSLDVTDVDPDVWYSLNITCLYGNRDVPFSLPCNNCDRLHNLSFLFPLDTSCTMYSFTITAHNDIGPGICRNNLQCMSAST